MKNGNEGSGSCRPAAPGAGGGTAGYLFPRRAVLPSPAPSDYTPCFCASWLAGRRGGRASRVRCVVLFPSLPCRQYSAVLKEGLGSLLFSQAFFFAHEKMEKKKIKKKHNEELVWLRLAEPWADGDVTPSVAVTGCGQTGHALSTHGAAIGPAAASHLGPPAAAQRLRGGSAQRRTKRQPSVKRKGISPIGTAVAPSPSPECLPGAGGLPRVGQGHPPGAAETMMMVIIVISRWNGIL